MAHDCLHGLSNILPCHRRVFLIDLGLSFAAVDDDLRLLISDLFIFIECYGWLLGSPELNLVTLRIVLFLVKSAERVDIAWP